MSYVKQAAITSEIIRDSLNGNLNGNRYSINDNYKIEAIHEADHIRFDVIIVNKGKVLTSEFFNGAIKDDEMCFIEILKLVRLMFSYV